MTIVKWTPFMEVSPTERRMRRLFDEIGFTPMLTPAADVYETDDEFVVELELPGYEQKEIAIEVFDHTIAIKGEREETTEDKAKEFAIHERLERQFERRVIFPAVADTEHVKATFAKGVLEVHAPKVKKAAPKQVAITS